MIVVLGMSLPKFVTFEFRESRRRCRWSPCLVMAGFGESIPKCIMNRCQGELLVIAAVFGKLQLKSIMSECCVR